MQIITQPRQVDRPWRCFSVGWRAAGVFLAMRPQPIAATNPTRSSALGSLSIPSKSKPALGGAQTCANAQPAIVSNQPADGTAK